MTWTDTYRVGDRVEYFRTVGWGPSWAPATVTHVGVAQGGPAVWVGEGYQIAIIRDPLAIRRAGSVPTSPTSGRYPHRCTRPGCGAPAYIGLYALDCSRPGCG